MKSYIINFSSIVWCSFLRSPVVVMCSNKLNSIYFHFTQIWKTVIFSPYKRNPQTKWKHNFIWSCPVTFLFIYRRSDVTRKTLKRKQNILLLGYEVIHEMKEGGGKRAGTMSIKIYSISNKAMYIAVPFEKSPSLKLKLLYLRLLSKLNFSLRHSSARKH